MCDVTHILDRVQQGDPKAAEELLPLVYDERQLAASRLAREQPLQTLRATALVHEAWLRLVGSQYPHFDDRLWQISDKSFTRPLHESDNRALLI